MIEQLTPEQEALLPAWRDKWTAIGLSCEPLNYEAAVDAATRAYRVAGLEPPQQFVACDSPLSGVITAAILKSGASVRDSVRASVRDSVGASVGASVGDSVWASVWDSVAASVAASVWGFVWAVWDSVADSVAASVYGSHDAHWLGFYDFFGSVCGLACVAPLQPLIDLAHHCGWWIPYENVCILQHRHSELRRDEQGRLHNPDGPAVLYRDGWGVYAWHGVRLSPGNEWIITDPAQLAPQRILDEQNAELRRVMLERYTPQKFIQEVNADKIDKNGDYVLYRAPFPDEPLMMLRCVDPSTGREYYLRVPPTMQSAWQAVAWTFGMDEAEYAPSAES